MSESVVNINCPNCKLSFDFILPMKMPRSNPQNRYFHGVVIPIISEYLGYTKDETKDLLKSMFLKNQFILPIRHGVKEVTIVRGSAELKTDEFEKFMEDIRVWASSELGCYVPEPNEADCFKE